MDGGQSEADEGRDEPRGHVHVALVGDGQDDDEEAGGGEGLVHDQRGRGRARVGERGEDAGALHVLAQCGGGVADAVGVDPVEDGRAQQGTEVLGEPVDGDLQSAEYIWIWKITSLSNSRFEKRNACIPFLLL